jgi:uncharacterized membrane protein YtjA (UPF0391 family)
MHRVLVVPWSSAAAYLATVSALLSLVLVVSLVLGRRRDRRGHLP